MRRIGKYKVIRELGSGGMAQVYVAHDNVGREVAIKLMKESADMDDELRRRFRREAEATAALSHRNIVTLYEFDEVDGVPYIVMENLGGTDLADLLRGHGGKSLAVDQCVDIALQAAAGLGYAHGRGVVHRDIKPSNVRVLDDGLVKIMDFGIAHVASSTITKTGVSIGTPQYMSPEQIHGNKVDHRTDIWSLGAVLYEMVSNHSPFVTDEDRKGFTIERVLRLQRRIVQDPTPSFESLGVEVPADLGRIIFRCLEKDPRDRYQSTAELIRALEHYQKLAVGAISSLEEEVARDIGKYLGLARALLANKNYQQAEAAARRVLVLDEGNSEANQVLADLEIAKRKDALEQRALALAEKARSAASQGDFAQANKLIERAVELAPDSRKLENVRAELSAERARQKIASLSQHLRQARNAIQENQLDGARRELEAAVAIDPGNTGIQKLTRDLERVERRAQALSHAREALARGDKNSAREIFETLLDANAGDVEARKLLRGVLEEEQLAVTQANPGLTTEYPLPATTYLGDAARLDSTQTVVGPLTREPETRESELTATVLPARVKVRRWPYVVVGFLIVAAVIGWWLPPGEGSVAVAIDIAPWAEIAYLRNLDTGQNVQLISTTTPCILELPPGEYEIKFVNPHFPEALTLPFQVRADESLELKMTLPGLELDDLALEF